MVAGKIYLGMPTAEEAHAAAIEYKTTHDENLFKIFLLRYEKLAEYACKWMCDHNKWIRSVERPDLYQTSYIGVYKAFERVKPTDPVRVLTLAVITHVKRELRSTFHYVLDEYRYYTKPGRNDGATEITQEVEDQVSATETYSKAGATELDEYQDIPGVTDREAEIISMLYTEGRTQAEVAAKLNLTKQRMSEAVVSIHEKLRKAVTQ